MNTDLNIECKFITLETVKLITLQSKYSNIIDKINNVILQESKKGNWNVILSLGVEYEDSCVINRLLTDKGYSVGLIPANHIDANKWMENVNKSIPINCEHIFQCKVILHVGWS